LLKLIEMRINAVATQLLQQNKNVFAQTVGGGAPVVIEATGNPAVVQSIKYPEHASNFDLWSAPAVFAEIARNPSMVHKGVFIIH
jgi:hypothetical protein